LFDSLRIYRKKVAPPKRKDEVIAEIMSEHIQLKKELGES